MVLVKQKIQKYPQKVSESCFVSMAKKRRTYFPAVNLEELIDRRQSLKAGYCQGAVVIVIYNELVISYSPVTKLALGPACSTLPDIDGP